MDKDRTWLEIVKDDLSSDARLTLERRTIQLLSEHRFSLLEVVKFHEALDLICWNIDNFNDLPLPDNYYEQWLKSAKAFINSLDPKEVDR